MVPFYGQGMNAGLEDVRVLFNLLDTHSVNENSRAARAEALKAYSEFRTTDAHVINDLALENYSEMRASVISPIYKARKWLEEKMSVWAPGMGWATKYSMVSFGNERYSEVVKQSERQGNLLLATLCASVGVPLLLGGVLGVWWTIRGARLSRLEAGRWREVFGWLSR